MLVVFVLTHESNGTLSIVLIERRHVEIINEVDELILANRAINFTSSTLKLLLKNGLEEHRVSVEIEIDNLLEILISFRRKIIEHTLNDLGLTATS